MSPSFVSTPGGSGCRAAARLADKGAVLTMFRAGRASRTRTIARAKLMNQHEPGPGSVALALESREIQPGRKLAARSVTTIPRHLRAGARNARHSAAGDGEYQGGSG